jgi:serine/threonine-protein kinase
LAGKSFEVAVQVILGVGRTLVQLHERGFGHRDIKPANILVKDDKFYLADFGLVDFPAESDLTSSGERIGATSTIAPEMRRNSDTAQAQPADVYSLAKTLWILLTGEKYGFDGQYDPNGVDGLRNLGLTIPDGFEPAELVEIGPLDDLLRASTNNDPWRRPSMQGFIQELEHWVKVYHDFRERRRRQWKDLQLNLFPGAMPQRAFWNTPVSIVTVIDSLGAGGESLTHMHFPGGNLHINRANLGWEPGTIEIVIDESESFILKPARLVFENLGGDTEWNYFWLETDKLEASGVGHIFDRCERLVEVGYREYISESEWQRDREREEGPRYPPELRKINRYLGGNFLFLQKASMHNDVSIDELHEMMGLDDYRTFVAKQLQFAQHLLDKEGEDATDKVSYDLRLMFLDKLRELYRDDRTNAANESTD